MQEAKKIEKSMKKCLHFILDVIFNYSFYRCGRSSGVERNLAKVDVEGSNPFTRSNSERPPEREVFLYRNEGGR